VTETSSQNANVVAEQLRSWNAKAVAEVLEFRGETTIVVPPDARVHKDGIGCIVLEFDP